SPQAVLRTHKTGINVLYAHGGGQWVDLERIMNRPPAAPAQWTDDYIWRQWRLLINENNAFSNPNVFNDFFLCERDYFGGSSGSGVTLAKLPVGVWVNLDHLSR